MFKQVKTMGIGEGEICLVPIEPFPRGGLELHKGIIEIAKESGINVVKPIQATSVSKQEKYFSDYIEPYKDQIESETSTRLEDIFYCSGEINLKGFIFLEAKDAMIYGSPSLWYLEPFNPTVLTSFLEAFGAAVALEVGKVIVKKEEKIAGFFKNVSEYLKFIKPGLVITSHGTIDEERLTPAEKLALADFAKKDNIIFITGWDYKDKSNELINTILKPEGLIMEGGTVLYPRKNGWREIRLFNQDEQRLVKRAWYAMLECMPQYLKEAIFMSQADEYSICAYINPPNDVVNNDLMQYRREEICSGKEFASKLRDKRIEPIEVGDKTIKILKNEENAYAAEKIIASHRTFKPYKMELKDDFILITLLPDDYKYTPIEKQVRNGVKIVPEILNEITSCVRKKVPIKNRIAPQTDICIDIFAKSKEEIIEKIDVIDSIGLRRSKEVIYISKSTRSDIPFIEQLSRVSDMWRIDFKAFGDATLPTELQSVGVRRIAEAMNAADLIKKLAETRNRTDLKFIIG